MTDGLLNTVALAAAGTCPVVSPARRGIGEFAAAASTAAETRRSLKATMVIHGARLLEGGRRRCFPLFPTLRRQQAHHAARHGSVPLWLVVVIRQRAPFTGSVSAACCCKHLGWRRWRRWCLPSGVLWAGGGEGLTTRFPHPDAAEGLLWRERALPSEAAGAPHSVARVGAALAVVIRQRAPSAGAVSAACSCTRLGWRRRTVGLWRRTGQSLFAIPMLWRACSGGSGPFRARQQAHRTAWHGSVPLLRW